MTVEDRLLMLDVLFNVHVALAPDRRQLVVSGVAEAIAFATPVLKRMKPEIVAHLRAVADAGRPA